MLVGRPYGGRQGHSTETGTVIRHFAKAAAVAALLVTSAGCATKTIETSLPQPVGISHATFEKKSWGKDLARWEYNAPNLVEHVKTIDPFAPKNVIETRRTQLSAAQLSALAAAISRVETESARPEGCDERVTDGPYGQLEWTRDDKVTSVKWDANCMKGRDADLGAAISAVDKIVTDAATAAPVAESREVANSGR